MKIHLADSEYWDVLGKDFQKLYIHELEVAYKEVAVLLPFGSPYLNFFVQPREYDLIDKTHDAGRTYNSEFIEMAFDPKYYAKQSNEVVRNHIRVTVYHEMNHAARFNLGIWHASFLDDCILEGLATVFERDHIAPPLWADYPKNVAVWLKEIEDNMDTLDRTQYLYTHDDGRRWIGYKVGTYLVDEAMKNSGKSIEELTKLECKDVLRMSKVVKV